MNRVHPGRAATYRVHYQALLRSLTVRIRELVLISAILHDFEGPLVGSAIYFDAIFRACLCSMIIFKVQEAEHPDEKALSGPPQWHWF